MTADEMRRAAEILQWDADAIRRGNTDEAGNWIEYCDEATQPQQDHDELSALATALRAHAAEVEAMREDAERYRWLRNCANHAHGGAPQVCLTDEFGLLVSSDASTYPQGEFLDAAIDAARKEGR